jgi:hypothetical protein
MDIQSLGKILLAVAALVAIVGVTLLLFGDRLNGFPGTLRVEGQGFTCIVPILASILLSIVGTIVLNLIIRWINRP